MSLPAIPQNHVSPSIAYSFWHPADEDEIVTSMALPRSQFGEDVWNLTALKGNSRWSKQLDFTQIRQLGVSEAESLIQLKVIIYLLLHIESEELPATSTFLGKYYALRTFAVEASKAGYLLYDAIGNVDFGLGFVARKPNLAVELYSVLVRLDELSEKFPVEIPLKQLHPAILKADKALRDAEKQTAVIPSRIYSHILGALVKELDMVESVLGDLIEYIQGAYTANRGNYPVPSQKLQHYAEFLGQSEAAPRLADLAGWISNVYAVCGAVIAANTGMRRGEVEALPFNALTTFTHGGTVHYCIRGYTTKFNKGKPREAEWVTNTSGARAVECAMVLARELHSLNGNGRLLQDEKSPLLLFPRHGFNSYGHYNGIKPQLAEIPKSKLIVRISPAIERVDIEELEQIDVDRNWQGEEKFAVGRPWPLTMHQFRRSLALYAHRSGLVTLPSLKSQLQHLTQEMAMYYTKGSIFAKSVIFDDDHFAHEWNAGRTLSEYLGYALQVLMSDERLFGGAAAWASSPAVKASPVSVYSRADAIRMFEKGEIAYRETVLGGCTSTTVCESSPLTPIPFQCLEKNCKNLVVSPRKIRKVIDSQQILVERLGRDSPMSVEHRLEKKGLEILCGVLAQIEATGA